MMLSYLNSMKSYIFLKCPLHDTYSTSLPVILGNINGFHTTTAHSFHSWSCISKSFYISLLVQIVLSQGHEHIDVRALFLFLLSQLEYSR